MKTLNIIALGLLLILVRKRLVQRFVHLEIHVHRDVDGLDLALGLDRDAASRTDGGECDGNVQCFHVDLISSFVLSSILC